MSTLGVGGMGRVVRVHDRWLRRDIALKEPVDDADAARLWHEALVTARLEHPGIVSVYDVGVGADGVQWFAMRVVRGRSLDALLADPERRAELQPLLRSVLAAAEAVGFAHSKGVVHCDLKPQNLMFGDFGETQVIDWGLAIAPGDPPTSKGGTPRYMSPEQRRGEPLDPRSDVYSLGVVLWELVAGCAPPEPTDRDADDDDPDDRAPALLPALGAFRRDVPAALADIVRRATEPDPARRYPYGKALADDLARFLDGRRVAAHAYTSAELLSRLVRAWRVPLTVAAVALVVLAAVLTMTLIRVADERDRAELSLARSLVDESRNALESGGRGEATVLATHALEGATSHGPALRPGDPLTRDSLVAAEARGVLGAIGLGRPRHEVIAHLPCAAADVHGAAVLCVGRDGVGVYADGRMRWRRPAAARAAAFGEGGRLVVTLEDDRIERYDAETGARVGEPVRGGTWLTLTPDEAGDSVVVRSIHAILRVDRASVEALVPRGCGIEEVSAAALDASGSRLAVVCTDGMVYVGDALAPELEVLRSGLPGLPRGPVGVAVAFVGRERLLLGDSDGGVYELLLGASRARRALATTTGIARRLVVSPGQRRALAIGDRGSAAIIDLSTFRSLGHLPDGSAPAAWFEADGAAMTAGADLHRWDLSALRPSGLDFVSGVVEVVVSPDGAQVAVTHENRVTLVDAAQRGVEASWSWQGNIVRVLAYGPDGSLVAQGLGGGPLRRYSPPQDVGSFRDPEDYRLRRIAVLADGSALTSSYRPELRRLTLDADPVLLAMLPSWDLAASPSGHHAAVLGQDGVLWSGRDLHAGGALEPRGAARDGRAVAVLDDGTIEVAAAGRVLGWRPGDHAPSVAYASNATELLAVAAVPGLVAAGASDGSVWLWRAEDPHPLAVYRVHRDRVDSLAFEPHGRWLVTSGWDGRLRFLDLPPAAPASSATVEAAWGLDLEAASASAMHVQ